MKTQDKTNEHRLYDELAEFVCKWIDKENRSGRKPFQSEIIGALEMVKADLYAMHSAERIITKRFGEIMQKLDGKSIQVDNKAHSITILKDDSRQKPTN